MHVDKLYLVNCQVLKILSGIRDVNLFESVFQVAYIRSTLNVTLCIPSELEIQTSAVILIILKFFYIER
jgi:hypothetical protein